MLEIAILSAVVALVAGISGGALGASAVARATGAALRHAVDRSEQVALDGGRAARETLLRSSALELLRAAGRVPTEVGALGMGVTREERRRGFAFLDVLRALGEGPAHLTPTELQERWADLTAVVHEFAHAWPVLDPADYGGDPVEEQLASGGWLPDVYEAARDDVAAYARYVRDTAAAVVQGTAPPSARPRPVLGAAGSGVDAVAAPI